MPATPIPPAIFVKTIPKAVKKPIRSGNSKFEIVIKLKVSAFPI